MSQLVQLRASANVTTAQLQQLQTLLQRLETSQTQLQNVLTQLGNVENPPAALTQLLSLRRGTVQPTQLQSLITQLQTLVQGQPTQAQIQQLLANVQSCSGSSSSRLRSVACPSHLVGTTAANTKNGKHGKRHG